MSREKVYLLHIVDASERLFSYLPADFDQYLKNPMAQDAVIKVLSNVTESAGHVETSTQKDYPDMAWKLIRGFRNVLVHEYLGNLDQKTVWQIIHEHLPKLVALAKLILKEKYGTEL